MGGARILDTIGFARHDHRACISGAVAAASAYCREHGLRLTPVRRRVLEILLAAHRAMGAYDLLEHLRAEGLGSTPPQAYRALDFLVAHGFAHRIEGLNAFIACTHPRERHAPVFLICARCGLVAEADLEPGAGFLGELAGQTGFAIERTVIEAQGICAGCRGKAEGTSA